MTEYNGGVYAPQPPEIFWAQFAEKQAIRRAAWAVAVPGMVFFLIGRTWGVLVRFITGVFGIDYEKAVAFLSDPAVTRLVEAVFSIFLMTVPFIICARLAGAKVSAIAGLNRPEKGNIIPYFFFGAGFCAFANIAVSVAGQIFKNFGIDGSVPDQKLPDGVFGFLISAISIAVIPALVEEFAFRGLVLGLLRRFGDVFAIFASSALFGILHGNFEQMPFAFLVGLVLAFVRIKTGSIVVPMAIHALNNFVSIAASYAVLHDAAAANLVYTVYIMLALLSAIFGIFLLRGKEVFTFPPSNGALGAKKKYMTFFFSPAIIIFSVLFFYRALTYVFN